MTDVVEKPTIEVFVTKYALTTGVYKATVTTDGSHYAYSVERYHQQFCKGEWYADEVEALKDAEARRKKKIASLRKQIKKLEAMTFKGSSCD